MSRHESSARNPIPSGEVLICNGQMCRRGNEDTKDALESELGDLARFVGFSTIACLSRCERAPNVQVGGTIFQRVGHNWTGTKISVVAEAVRESLGDA